MKNNNKNVMNISTLKAGKKMFLKKHVGNINFNNIDLRRFKRISVLLNGGISHE